MDALLLIISFLLIMGAICQTSIGEEPVCSKFDFEEKLLEKMVKIDHKTGLMTDSFHEYSTQVKTELATMKADIEKQRLDQHNFTAETKTQIQAEVTNMKTEIQQRLEQRDSSIEISNRLQEEVKMIKADIMKHILEREVVVERDFQDAMANMKADILNLRKVSTDLQTIWGHTLRETEKMKDTMEQERNIRETLQRNMDDLSNAFAEVKVGKRQPSYAFSASDLSASRPKAGTILVFSKTYLDDHGVYNNQTGKFTAPISGIYTFSATINSMVNKAVRVEFVAGEESIGKFMALDKVWDSSASGCATARLEAGMEAYLRVISVLSGFHFRDDYYYMNTFSGYLIESD